MVYIDLNDGVFGKLKCSYASAELCEENEPRPDDKL